MYFFKFVVPSVIVNLACIVMLRTNLLIHSSDFQMAEDMERFQNPSNPTFQKLQTYTAAQLQIFVHKFGLPTTVPKAKLLSTAHPCILMGPEEKPTSKEQNQHESSVYTQSVFG